MLAAFGSFLKRKIEQLNMQSYSKEIKSSENTTNLQFHLKTSHAQLLVSDSEFRSRML